MIAGWVRISTHELGQPPFGHLPIAQLGAVFAYRDHEDDVGRALLQCVVAAGPPGACNVAADGVLSLSDVAREVGLRPLPAPQALARVAARAVMRLPALPAVGQWVAILTHPAIMDSSRARAELGWTPEQTARQSLREALRSPGEV